jgi:hypothetical protein
MVGFVELTRSFNIPVEAKHTLPDRETVRKQHQKSEEAVIRESRKPKLFRAIF